MDSAETIVVSGKAKDPHVAVIEDPEESGWTCAENKENDPNKHDAVEKMQMKAAAQESSSADVLEDEKGGAGSANPSAPKKGKRKTQSKMETSPAKKTKPVVEDFCLFVGNLNSAKDVQEILSALEGLFSARGLPVQNTSLNSSRKHGFISFSTEEDRQKALELNGETVLEKPMRLALPKVKKSQQSLQEGHVSGSNAKTLFVRNIPFTATKADLKKVFNQAIDIRLPAENGSSKKGIAYLEFRSEVVAEKVLKQKQGVELQGRVLVLDFMGEKSQRLKADMPSTGNTLVVHNLASSVTEERLKKAFEKAVTARIPRYNGKPKGYAFLEFGSAEEAQAAIEKGSVRELGGRAIRLDHCTVGQHQSPQGTSHKKRLFIKGLSETTSEEVLKGAFDGAIAARLATDKDTGVSKRFGFVDFETKESCEAAKEAMEDCEIDGAKVTIDYAKVKVELGEAKGKAKRGLKSQGHGGKGGGQKKGKGGRKKKKNSN